MLSRTFEWHRIVDPKPSSETIDNRTAAARDLVKLLSDSSGRGLILDAVSGVVSGFESGFLQDAPIVQAIVGSIRAHDSAFPQNLSENALELRAMAATALGELMVAKGGEPDQVAIAIASLLRCGQFLRPALSAKYLKEMIDELGSASAKVLQTAGEARRERLGGENQFRSKPEAEPTDLATALTTLQSLRKTVKGLVQQSTIDREELNVLWWMFAGSSRTSRTLLENLPPGAAAITCGAELGTMCLVPHSASIEAMACRAFLANRGTIPDHTIEAIASEWTPAVQSALVPDDEAKKSALAHPTLFPLSWLAARLLASEGMSGCAAEFEQKTKLSASTVYPYTSIALQALIERSAQRCYLGETGE